MTTLAVQWRDVVLAATFRLDTERLDKIVTDLAEQNNTLQGRTAPGFRHRGTLCIPRMYEPAARQWLASRQPLPVLSAHLNQRGDEMHVQRTRIELDRTLISQLLTRFYGNREGLQDIRDATPDCLARLVPELNALPRSPHRPDPLWAVDDNPVARRLYDKMLPKMEMYSILQLMY